MPGDEDMTTFEFEQRVVRWLGSFEYKDATKAVRLLKYARSTLEERISSSEPETTAATATAAVATTRTASSCRNPDCHRAPDSTGFYCTHCGWRLWQRLQLEVKRVHEASRNVLVGRTGAVEKRHLIHLADSNLPFFTVLHWARGRAEAEYYERRISETLRPVSRKLIDYRPGESPSEGNFYTVYIAWAPKRNANLADFTFVDTGRDVVWPVRFPAFTPLHLRSPLTQGQAKALRPPKRKPT